MQPSPLPGRVGVHITTFEACSSFTRVTACRVAPPPYVGFIARLRPSRLPSSDARKLPSSTNNLLVWVLPPLVICAFEAHPTCPFTGVMLTVGCNPVRYQVLVGEIGRWSPIHDLIVNDMDNIDRNPLALLPKLA